MDIFIGKDGKQEGPWPVEEVLARLADGRLARDDLAWCAGAPGWRKLGDFLAERNLLPEGEPPPLPGGPEWDLPPTEAAGRGRVSDNDAMQAASHAVLKERYGVAFLATFLEGILESIPGMIPFIGALLRLIFSPIFQIGLLTYFMKRARPAGPPPEINDLFAAFGFIGRAMGAFWFMAMWLFLWSLPALGWVSLSFLLILPSEGGHAAPSAPSVIILMTGFLAFVGILTVVGYRYALHLLLCLDNPAKPVSECLKESIRLMDGHKWRFFVQQLYLVWKPLVALLVLMGAGAGCALALIAWAPAGESGKSTALLVGVAGGMLLFGLFVPVLYFMVRARLRASVARVIFYDELVFLSRRKGASAIRVRPDRE